MRSQPADPVASSVTVVADTGPLVAAANAADEAHHLAAALITALGRRLVVPIPVLVEADHLLRGRVSSKVARLLLASLTAGEHEVAFLSRPLLHRAVEFDSSYAALGLGFADGCVMAIAEAREAPILTFDFGHFRATTPRHGHWRLVVDEQRYRAAVQ